ncbi:hypothetical protein Deipe_0462 [Deinococcus peraridilitoris DSM 19664]|uniref:Uncharacterized protein n=1 Tax=Deinococcus peraridilitoris (strain DSM 19664 / LMG 22246 / CIP 109416 / KR-200) TaxID=937777 RepID=K9ZWN3_DEIPD|nr:hypothetical protein Deipe_0462 [Deinococcus peraridilitoris DSM 19664]
MTVAELIEKLKAYPQDMRVLVPSVDGRTLGFEPELDVANIVEDLGDRAWFSQLQPGPPILLIGGG